MKVVWTLHDYKLCAPVTTVPAQRCNPLRGMFLGQAQGNRVQVHENSRMASYRLSEALKWPREKLELHRCLHFEPVPEGQNGAGRIRSREDAYMLQFHRHCEGAAGC